MIDFASLLLDPVYDALGVSAVLTPATDASEIPLTVLDKTEGVILESPLGLQMATSKPAACVRLTELKENGLVRSDLKKGQITFNGGCWTIVATQPKPAPDGSGELYLVLEATDG